MEPETMPFDIIIFEVFLAVTEIPSFIFTFSMETDETNEFLGLVSVASSGMGVCLLVYDPALIVSG